MLRKLPIITCITLGIASNSCGKWASAKKQPVESIAIPDHPSFEDNVYSLSPSINSVGYGGTMVIFNQSVDAHDLADILQASIDSRAAWGSVRKFTEETNYSEKYAEGGIYERAIADMKAELNRYSSAEKAKISLSEAQLKDSAESFLEAELDLIFKSSSQDKLRARSILNRFCEAKIWELATNSFFAANSYSERPSPLAICEPYYRERELLTGEACEPEATGKSYFSCLWQEGVQKTSFYDEYPAESREVLDQMLSQPSLDEIQSILALEDNAFTFPKDIYRDRTIGKNKENRDYFSKIILQQSSGSRLCQAVIPEQKELCSSFSQSRSLNADALSLSPQDTMSMVEGSNVEKASLFPLETVRSSGLNTKDLLAYLSTRQKHENSESDRLFHQIVAGNKLSKPIFSDERLSSNSGKIEDELGGVFYPLLSGVALEQVESRKGQIARLESDLDEKTRQYQALQAAITKSSDEAFNIGNRQGVAHAFSEIRLKVSNHDGILRSYFWLRDFENHAVIACLDLETRSALSSQCQAHPNDYLQAKHFFPAKLFTVDKETGRVELEFDLFDPASLGFVKKDRVTELGAVVDSFSDFAAQDYLGKSLYFELYPNMIMGHMEILTGKAFLREGGTQVEEAAVSLWDQNL